MSVSHVFVPLADSPESGGDMEVNKILIWKTHLPIRNETRESSVFSFLGSEWILRFAYTDGPHCYVISLHQVIEGKTLGETKELQKPFFLKSYMMDIEHNSAEIAGDICNITVKKTDEKIWFFEGPRERILRTLPWLYDFKTNVKFAFKYYEQPPSSFQVQTDYVSPVVSEKMPLRTADKSAQVSIEGLRDMRVQIVSTIPRDIGVQVSSTDSSDIAVRVSSVDHRDIGFQVSPEVPVDVESSIDHRDIGIEVSPRDMELCIDHRDIGTEVSLEGLRDMESSVDHRDIGIEVFPEVPSDMELLSRDVSLALQKEILTDVILECGGRAIRAHKCVLAFRSEVFRRMFENEMFETEAVKIPNMDFEVLDKLVKFIYSGKLYDLSEDCIVELYKAAAKYSVLSLKKFCAYWIVRNLNVERCVKYLKVAESHSDSDTRAAIISFIIKHPDVFISPEWLALSEENSDLGVKVLQAYIDSNDHLGLSEENPELRVEVLKAHLIHLFTD